MKKILIPTDFSENSKKATDYGINLFDAEGTVFVFLNTFYIPYSADEVSFTYDGLTKDNAEKLFEEEKERIQKQFPELKAQMEFDFEIGDVVGVANSVVARENIDYIVMGTKGASGLNEFLVGSRTASMIKEVECPLIIVPEKASFKRPEKILFTTDKELQKVDLDLGILVKIAKKYNSSVHAYYVSKSGENKNVEANFIKYDLDVKLVDVKHDLEVSINADPIDAIESYMKKYPVDLIAMISTKGNLFHELFHTSVTKKIAMHTDIPMLIMHTKV